MKSLSCAQLLATPWTAAHQAPLSMGFSRQEYWSGLPLWYPYWSINVSQKHTLSLNFIITLGSICFFICINTWFYWGKNHCSSSYIFFSLCFWWGQFLLVFALVELSGWSLKIVVKRIRIVGPQSIKGWYIYTPYWFLMVSKVIFLAFSYSYNCREA